MIKVSFTNEEFYRLRLKTEEEYKKIEKVYCPYFKNFVYFNAKGLNHIKMKKWNHARNKKDQYMRLKFLHLAPDIIKTAHNLQGFREVKQFEKIQTNSRWEKVLKNVCFYDFVCVLKGIRLRVIVKKIEGRETFFWSIVPFWKQTKNGKILHDGNPEED